MHDTHDKHHMRDTHNMHDTHYCDFHDWLPMLNGNEQHNFAVNGNSQRTISKQLIRQLGFAFCLFPCCMVITTCQF